MRADRIFPQLASLGAMLALCLAVAAPARADVVFIGQTTLPADTSSFNLILNSTEPLAGIGFEFFRVTLSFTSATGEQYVSASSVERMAALPMWDFGSVPGWDVTVSQDNNSVDVLFVGDEPAVLPAGDLLNYTFDVNASSIFTQRIAATLTFYDIDDQEIIPFDQPLTAVADVTVVPEPSSWLLMAAGLIGLGLVAARRRT